VHHNAKTVEAHVLEYQQIISDLQMQVASLKLELHSSTKKPIGQHALPDPAADDDWQVRVSSRCAWISARKRLEDSRVYDDSTRLPPRTLCQQMWWTYPTVS
jgi:hypothetical protein